MATKICPVCHTEFTCGATPENQVCWCSSFPKIMPVESKQGCLCKTCLAKAIAERIDETIRSNSHNQMLEIASQYRNDDRLIEYIDYTIENASCVFTKWYHLKRGTCCGNGCRNCPYTSSEKKQID